MNMDMNSITGTVAHHVGHIREGLLSTRLVRKGRIARAFARPAGLLRVLSGAPAGTEVRTHRRGSFLVLVVGTLALLAVITIVYVALGSQDARTKSAVQERAQLDDVPSAVADYTAGVIARDLFSSTLDGSMVQLQSGDVALALRRETDDAPGMVHRQGVNAQGNNEQFYRLTSARDPLANTDPLLARNYFTPEGTVHPVLEQALQDPTSTETSELRPGAGALGEFRLPSSDPWLMPLRPAYINFRVANDNGDPDTFVADPDAPLPYLQQLDWTSITNIAPDGMFVNLANLRGNFGAFSNTDDGSNNANLLPGMGFGKTLLQPQTTTGNGPGRYRFRDSTANNGSSITAWGLDLSQFPLADENPFYWSVLQEGAFRPAKPALGAPDPTEDPASEFYKGLQWADADGDGMLDSRWWELRRWQDPATGQTVTISGDQELPEFAGNFRWFIASRIVDLSGLVNVNFAGDLAAAIRSPMFLDPSIAADATVARGANTTMALGMTPADIDLRRLLIQADTYANYDFENDTSIRAGYEGLEPDLSTLPTGGVDTNALSYERAMDELRAFRAGSSAYMGLQIASQYGQIVGIQAREPDANNVFQLIEDQDVDLSSADSAKALAFMDEFYGVGGIPPAAVDTPDGVRSTFGLRGWQTFAFPSQRYTANAAAPFNVGAFANIRNYPPYGPDVASSAETHYGWIEWSARRTLNYINQSRKVNAATGNPFEQSSVAKLRFGVSDLAELLTYRGINDPAVTSDLEKALGARDETPPILGGQAEDLLRIDPLRSNRELQFEAMTFDPFSNDNDDIYGDPDQPMGRVLRRHATDVRQYLTTISLSRPLRTTIRPANAANTAASTAAYVSSLDVRETKINAREALDLPPRAKDSLPTQNPARPPYVASAETTARILFNGYADALAPLSSLDGAWDRSATEFPRLRTMFYGYRGAELATLTAGHMAVNMVDLADGPVPAPLLVGGPDVWVEGNDPGVNRAVSNGRGNIENEQTQPVRPGVSDIRDKPTIRALIMTDDVGPVNFLNGTSAQSIAARRIMATWQRPGDLASPDPNNPLPGLDNLDLTSEASTRGRLAPEIADTIAPVVKLYGIEAQPFVTQVTTMSVYFDNWFNDPTGGFNEGTTAVEISPPVAAPQVPADPSVVEGANNLIDGASVNRSELLFNLVAFKITNPFDRDIVLGKPLMSDVPPNSVAGVADGPANNPAAWQYNLPDQPIELVPDPALRSISSTLLPSERRALLGANRDAYFPFRSDRLGIYSRVSRWATTSVVTNPTGSPAGTLNVVGTYVGPGAFGANNNWSRTGPVGVFGAWGRGDLIDVSDPAFLNAATPVAPVDSISDFHYIRFGSRSYMLMALNEQYTFSESTADPANTALDYYLDRPDGLLAIPGQYGVPGDPDNPADLQRASAVPPGLPATVRTTLNPIRIPAGKTVVCYALSESPHRIRERLVEINNSNPSAFQLATTNTPAGGGGGAVGTDGLVDDQPWLELGPFIKRVIENQLARAGEDTSLATDLFNPNGAYWVPMLWERPAAAGASPPPGFSNAGMQNINLYVNPIPPEAAPETTSTIERTVTLWRTVREQPPVGGAGPGISLESAWFPTPGFATHFLDDDITAAAQGGDQLTINRRPQGAVSSSAGWRMGPNAWDNDQMVDRLRIPFGANLSTQMTFTTPINIAGTHTSDDDIPTTPQNEDPDVGGYSVVFWASVMRPSDPQSNQDTAPGAPYDPQQNVPNDVIPGYCLEAKYWDNGTAGQTWNIYRPGALWDRYLNAPSTFAESDFSRNLTGSNAWQGGAANLGLLVEFLSGTPGFVGPGANLSNEQPLADAEGLPSNYLWQAPNNIRPRGYLEDTGDRLALGSPFRALIGSIDQRPNATIFTPLAPGAPLLPLSPPGVALPTGYLAFSEMYPQVTMDADAERGRMSNNFYRDMDVRRSSGNAGTSSVAGSAARFNESDHHYRWVSILRLGDMLRPMGVGPLEAPFTFPAGGGAPTVRTFTPVATTVPQIQANNSRYTTLGEALAAAMGYENRDFAGIPRHAGQQLRDINLLRSPYALPLPGESSTNGDFHLKPPPGARSASATTIQLGDDSMDTMLFDRGNLRLDHFVPFIDADAPDTVMDPTTTGVTAERVVGPAVPLAQMVLEQFETPANDPANPAPITGENAGRFAARQGLINVNTAPVEVLRLLPGVSPRAYAEEADVGNATSAPLSGTKRDTTLPPLLMGEVGDANWFRGVPGVRPDLPVNQTLDLAAGIAGYRDMIPVVMGRAAYEHVQNLRILGAGADGILPDATTATTYEPVASLFLPVVENTAGDVDPFVDTSGSATNIEGANPRYVARIMGLESQPGFRSVGELLSVRSRRNESVPTGSNPVYASRWPAGSPKPANEPRFTPWAAAPYNIDALGYDQSVVTVSSPPPGVPGVQRRALNSTFDEIDPQAGRIDLGLPVGAPPPTGFPPSEDDPFDNPYERQLLASRNDASQATAGIANEYDEKLILANNFLNTVTNRSDVYAVWFTLAGFQRSDVEGLDAGDPITPSVRRRFVMVVDRSNVTNRGTKPRILLMKEVPMPRE